MLNSGGSAAVARQTSAPNEKRSLNPVSNAARSRRSGASPARTAMKVFGELRNARVNADENNPNASVRKP